ncbi:MAG: phage integrase N-terminal SAM-like domain-containing protein, partial [Bacillota bacterium]
MKIGISDNLTCFHVKFKYDRSKIVKIRKIKGSFYNVDDKHWNIPISKINIDKVFNIFIEDDIIISKSFKNNRNILQNNQIKYLLHKYYEKNIKKALLLKGYSKKTIKVYLSHIKLFLNYNGFKIKNINETKIKNYLLYLLEEKEVSHSYVNQSISAI